jgi:hypothetical protein
MSPHALGAVFLLPHELQSPQAQAPQPDLILEFREQAVHLLSLSLCVGKMSPTSDPPSCPKPGSTPFGVQLSRRYQHRHNVLPKTD